MLYGISYSPITESGHGKDTPNGIGAISKRTTDFVVATGGDINNMETFVKAIQEKWLGIIINTIYKEAIQKVTDEKIEKKAFNAVSAILIRADIFKWKA